MKVARQIFALVLILLLGALLRFWHLDLKPLWMDEVITALFSLGRTYYDIPLDRAVPLAAFEQVFTFNPAASCAQIAMNVLTQSVHPPLFFCWMHGWLSWLNSWSNLLPVSWVWQVRSLPALVGVAAIAAVYQFSAVAFSRRAALISAAFMAVSPFAVYLSQEARHYTLPMLLVTLALLGLYQMLLDLQQRQFRPLVWLGWVIANSLGFYVHYFFLLAFVAQVVTLLLEARKIGVREKGAENHFLPFTLHSLKLPLIAIALVCAAYLLWLPTLLSHMNRPETEWVNVQSPGIVAAIAPLVQLVGGWVLMGIALPVENQLLWLNIFNGCLMAGFSIWFVWCVGGGIWRLERHQATQLATRMLRGFTLTVLLEFLAIAYILGKDLTQVPRYNFIYFPAVCALVGAGLSYSPLLPKPPKEFLQQRRSKIRAMVHSTRRQAVWIVLLVGILSSSFVVSNRVFQKPYRPDQVAAEMYLEPQLPLLVTAAYDDFQDLALGLSFALQLAKQEQSQRQSPAQIHFAFVAQLTGYEGVWNALAVMPQPLPFPLNLWVISPGLKRVGYKQTLTLRGSTELPHTCTIDPAHYHRLGIPYQLYRCS